MLYFTIMKSELFYNTEKSIINIGEILASLGTTASLIILADTIRKYRSMKWLSLG